MTYKNYIDENFLLTNETGRMLYDSYAKNMPIIDFHCHLNPKEIAENKQYSSITEAWLGGDHYKWRAMRSNGIDESYITGNAPEREKFRCFAGTMPYLIGNPLHQWAHLELKRFFGIDLLLCPDNADTIYDMCNEALKTPDFTARNLIIRSNVRAICTTDDPADDLKWHKLIADDASFPVRVVPSFRPDKALNIQNPDFKTYLISLTKAAGIAINSLDSLKSALSNRIDFFKLNGCRVSDHGLDPWAFSSAAAKDPNLADGILKKALSGSEVSFEDAAIFRTTMMIFLAREYAKHNWIMQLHIGTQRNTNTLMFNKLGPDTGFDTISDDIFGRALTGMLDAAELAGGLPKTIVYCNNPRDYEMIVSIIGAFQGGGVPGKIQFGSAWWFSDQVDGTRKQMTALANMGLLRRFVGMLTDSRSLLSYTRHEYFRRILCGLLGGWADSGEIPKDISILGSMVQDICYYNAESYFGFA